MNTNYTTLTIIFVAIFSLTTFSRNDPLTEDTNQLENTEDFAPTKNDNDNQIYKKYFDQIRKMSLEKQKEFAFEACNGCNQQFLEMALKCLQARQYHDMEFEQELLEAAINCHDRPEILDELAKFRINFNSPLQPIKTLARVAANAAHTGKLGMLKKMLEHGADPNGENKNNGEIIGSTLSLLLDQIKATPDKYPAGAEVLSLLKASAQEKALPAMPCIAKPTTDRIGLYHKGV